MGSWLQRFSPQVACSVAVRSKMKQNITTTACVVKQRSYLTAVRKAREGGRKKGVRGARDKTYPSFKSHLIIVIQL